MAMLRSETGNRQSAIGPYWILALITLASLGPFIAKPFNVDDPLFIWVARHIQLHPANPYDFKVNWYGWTQPVWEITKNPPLASYYMAAVASVTGWSEPALHAAFLLPVIAAILGTYRLARHFCQRPLLAALITLFSPVLLISSTTVMCDVLMQALWIWAVIWWMEGTEQKSLWHLAGAGFLIGLAVLTKYFAICLIPLLAVWSLLKEQKPKNWIGFLLIPVAILAAYQMATHALYGHGLLSDAASYATDIRSKTTWTKTFLTALAFAGGCLAPVLFFAPVLWRPIPLMIGTAASVLLLGAFCLAISIVKPFATGTTSSTAVIVQIVFWGTAGFWGLALVTADLVQRRDADTWLLWLWTCGTFAFTAFFNWTVNGRSLLPMAIPVGILIARQLDQRADNGAKITFMTMALPLAASTALAMWVVRSDFVLAQAVRETAQGTLAKYPPRVHTLWFQGHHGFQYYMEAGGALPLDLKNSAAQYGDYVANPSNNANVNTLAGGTTLKEDQRVRVAGPSWLATVSADAGAGFYTSEYGPLPFAFGRIPPEEVTVYYINPWQYVSPR